MPTAIWNDTVIAQSDDTGIVEGNHYFPSESVRSKHLSPSDHHSQCYWKGEASYYHVVVAGKTNPDAAWYYSDPLPAAELIRGRIAFWKGVQVVD